MATTAWLVTLAAVIAIGAAVAAGRANAAPHKPPHPAKEAKLKKPKLDHGVLTIKGSEADDKIALRLQGGQPGILQIDAGDDGSADFAFDRADIASIAVDARDGEDVVRVDESNGLFTDTIPTTIDGGDGNDTLTGGAGAVTLIGGAGDDTLTGGAGAETLTGGDGNDSIDGNRGNDTALMGAGDDTFVWDPGDGSDTVEGQDGTDTMRFNGANVNERMDLSANGTRLRFTRDIANIVMDTDDVERVDVNALGGADTITLNDLTGTDVTQLDVDLGATDGQPDQIIVNATSGGDVIRVDGSAGTVNVTGLATAVNVTHAEPANDTLTINALAGDDVVDASALASGALNLLAVNSGAGTDSVIGSAGDDRINGGSANDLALMGAGDDTFVWNPGEGSDTVEGQAGTDTMLFNGANINERVELSANGGRLRFTRDIANIVMDTNDVERVDFNALGGADTITLNDLTGTDVTQLHVDLGANGAGDGAPDQIIVNATNGDDVIDVDGSAGTVNVTGLATFVNVTHAEPANDTLTIDAHAGDDVVEAVALAASSVKLTAAGGDGNDILLGSAGADTLLGAAGDDVLIGGPGQDVLDGGPGDNILIQD